MPKPINESVRYVLREEGWTAGAPILEASLDRMMTHIAGKSGSREEDEKGRLKVNPDAHFAILSSYRKFHMEADDPAHAERDRNLQGELSRWSSEEGRQDLPRHLHNLKSPHEPSAKGEAPHGTRRFNEAGFQRLIRDIKNRGLGAIRTSGLWAEGKRGDKAEGKPSGTDEPFERSVFIPSKPKRSLDEPGTLRGKSKSPLTLAWVKGLGKKFNQESVIYMGPDSDEAGAVNLYEIDEKGEYKKTYSWSLAGHKTPEDIQKGINKMRELARKHEEEGELPEEEKGQFVSATVPRGSGKKSTFEPDPEVEARGGERTRRSGFAFECEQGSLIFWPELLIEHGAMSPGARLRVTLDSDPFYDGPAPAGGLIF